MQSELNVEEVVNDRSMKVRLNTRFSRDPVHQFHKGHYLRFILILYNTNQKNWSDERNIYMLFSSECTDTLCQEMLFKNCLFVVPCLCRLVLKWANPLIKIGVDLLGVGLSVWSGSAPLSPTIFLLLWMPAFTRCLTCSQTIQTNQTCAAQVIQAAQAFSGHSLKKIVKHFMSLWDVYCIFCL